MKGVGHVTYFFMRGFLIENKLTVTHKSNMLFLFFFFMRGVTVTHKSKGGGGVRGGGGGGGGRVCYRWGSERGVMGVAHVTYFLI